MLAYGSTMVFEERYHPYTCSTRPLVKLQPESPCPSPNSDISYGRSRSTTPETKPQIPDPRTSLPFSISNILKPDFGRTKPQPIYRPYDLVKPAERQQNQQQIRPDSANSSISTGSSTVSSSQEGATTSTDGSSNSAQLWPAWVYCTRYSDRPSSGPRSRRAKKCPKAIVEDKRPRTAFSGAQLGRLKNEFNENRYLTERRRQQLASELGLAEAQIKIWFQNKRAKIKKSSGQKNPLAIQLMAQGLYNHRTVTESEDEEEIHVT